MWTAPETLARRLGTTSHRSLLLHRAARLGLDTIEALEALAAQRGCSFYPLRTAGAVASAPNFTDEELAIALMHPSLPWDPQRLRFAAAMTAARGNDPIRLTRLARQERAERVLAAIASAGQACEPENAFWSRLMALLAGTLPPPPGVVPHPSRFMAISGRVRPGRIPQSVWVRPALAV